MSTLGRYNLLSPYLVQLDKAVRQNSDELQAIANNAQIMGDAYGAYICCASDLLFNAGHPEKGVISRLDRLVCYLCKQSISVVLCTAKTAYDLLISCISLKEVLSYSDFKDQLIQCGNSSTDVDAFLAPINKHLTRALHHHTTFQGRIWRSDATEDVKILSQYFGFLVKTSLENPSLEEAAITSYNEMEDQYPDGDWRGTLEAEKLREKIHMSIKNYSYDGSLARHGSGAVAEKGVKGKYSKYHTMPTDTLVNYPYKGSLDDHLLFDTNKVLTRESRLAFVPKTAVKLRSISMEPTTLQFVQQGVMRSLYKFFKKEPSLKSYIKLEDQSQNRCLAYDGSITDFYSTIDLSSASDLVSWDLVKYLFKGTHLYPWILSTRSRTTRTPDGSVVNLKKFAPMGSALCFPIETLIFNAIASLAIDAMEMFGYQVPSSLKFHSTYGDDIIIPYYAYDMARLLLKMFGFQINEAKSYNNSPFKESCGINCFCGVDITPLRYKRPSLSSDRAKYYASGIDSCNQAYERGYRILRCYLIASLKKEFYVPFTSERGVTGAIYSTHATNFHLPHKVDHDLQKVIYMYDSLKVKVDQPYNKADLEVLMYFEWLKEHREIGALCSKNERRKRFESIRLESAWTNGGRLASNGCCFVFDQPSTDESGYLKTQVLVSRHWHKGTDVVVGTQADIAVLLGRPLARLT